MSESLRACICAPSLRWRLAGVCAISLATAWGLVYAQTEFKAEFQVYALKHKAAGDVEKILAEMLPGVGTTTQVVADPRNNQILVRGSEEAQQIARQLIESIDRGPDQGGRRRHSGHQALVHPSGGSDEVIRDRDDPRRHVPHRGR